jgi:hypothetical protein
MDYLLKRSKLPSSSGENGSGDDGRGGSRVGWGGGTETGRGGDGCAGGGMGAGTGTGTGRQPGLGKSSAGRDAAGTGAAGTGTGEGRAASGGAVSTSATLKKPSNSPRVSTCPAISVAVLDSASAEEALRWVTSSTFDMARFI